MSPSLLVCPAFCNARVCRCMLQWICPATFPVALGCQSIFHVIARSIISGWSCIQPGKQKVWFAILSWCGWDEGWILYGRMLICNSTCKGHSLKYLSSLKQSFPCYLEGNVRSDHKLIMFSLHSCKSYSYKVMVHQLKSSNSCCETLRNVLVVFSCHSL